MNTKKESKQKRSFDARRIPSSFFEYDEMLKVGHGKALSRGGFNKDISELAKEGNRAVFGWLFRADRSDFSDRLDVDLPQAYHFSIFGCEYFADSVDKLIAFIRFAQEQIGQ